MTVLVIGYGNPLRADDGAGWHAAHALADDVRHGVRTMAVHQLTPELAAAIAESAGVVFIDASRDGPPGTLATRTIEPDARGGTMTHHVRPSTLLAAARILFGRCPPAAIVSIGGEHFDHGEHLSPIVSAALPGALAHVRAWVARFRCMGAEGSATCTSSASASP
jgi:hydrogenase maturation protease